MSHLSTARRGSGRRTRLVSGHIVTVQSDNQYFHHVIAPMTRVLASLTILLALLCWHLAEGGKFLHDVCIYDKLRYDDSRDAYFFYTNPKRSETLDVELTREVFEKGSLEVEQLKCRLQKHFIREEHRLWILCCNLIPTSSSASSVPSMVSRADVCTKVLASCGIVLQTQSFQSLVLPILVVSREPMLPKSGFVDRNKEVYTAIKAKSSTTKREMDCNVATVIVCPVIPQVLHFMAEWWSMKYEMVVLSDEPDPR
ncbi:hypothetical protein ECG_07788 [Echinococcus granulosus]|nr:hypothetical protein ECG_07788 [Echinococcus granulosus]